MSRSCIHGPCRCLVCSSSLTWTVTGLHIHPPLAHCLSHDQADEHQQLHIRQNPDFISVLLFAPWTQMPALITAHFQRALARSMSSSILYQSRTVCMVCLSCAYILSATLFDKLINATYHF